MRQQGRPAGSFIRVSEAANLALHALMLLASRASGLVQTREVGEALGASRNHLEKVLQRLVRAGLVVSTRGPRGGFVLAQPPAKVTLLDVYEAIEGAVAQPACLLGQKRCTGACMLGELVVRANAEIAERFARTRLSDVAGTFKPQTRGRGKANRVPKRARHFR